MGWYRDVDKRIFRGLEPRVAAGGAGRGQMRGGGILRGAPIPVLRGGSTIIKPSVNVGRSSQNSQD